MAESLMTYSVKQNIAHIGLNDPNRLNVLSVSLVRDLSVALQNAERDMDVKVIVLFGHGRSFCAGGDLKAFFSLQEKPHPDPVSNWENVYSCCVPVIAAVHGHVLGGGCEVMMMTDYIISAEDASFGQPELLLGFIPGCGATKRLPKKIGYTTAFDMMATGNRITAETAKKIGLVDEVTESNFLLKVAHEKAVSWAMRSKEELINLKKVMRGYANERETFYHMLQMSSSKERIEGFLKRK